MHRPIWRAVCAPLLLAVTLGGCPTDAGNNTNTNDSTAGGDNSNLTSLFGLVAGATVTADDDGSDSSGPTTPTNNVTPAPETTTLTGRVAGAGNWQMFDLGARSAGDRVGVSSALFSPTFVVALFDENDDLQLRSYMSAGSVMSLTVRKSTTNLQLGVMPPSSGGGGDFRLTVTSDTASVPQPAAQVVWLNFAGANNVRIANQAPVSFGAFDGAMIGTAYVGHTDEMKQAIVAAMRNDYLGYNVSILSSDDGPPPSGSYSVIHFGAYASGLLGLADAVDAYNGNPNEEAIVYIESFAPYWTMQLTPPQMGGMIANVGSHELGHLLGLFHTRAPADVMDTTGTAWELAADQSFIRAPLEQSVFATGLEDSPALLALAVGTNPAAKTAAVAREKSEEDRLLIRAAQRLLAGQCGTCRNLDHK